MATYYRDKDGQLKKKKEPVKYKFIRNTDGKLERVVDTGYAASEDRTFFKKGAFEDGYQLGDVLTSTVSTIGDASLGILQGAGNMLEGVADLGMYGVAGLSDLVGADSFADDVRNIAKKNSVDDLAERARDFAFQDSLLGEKSIDVASGLGQVGTMLLTAGAGQAAGLGSAGVSALSSGTMFASSTGAGMSEAYQSGASDGEALAYGALKGAVDAGSELLFGGLGKSVKALGVSKGISSLDDMFAKKLSSKISNQAIKTLSEYGIKAAGEGVEEVLAGLGSAVAKKLTYMSDTELKQLVKDEKLMDQFVTGAITSGIVQGGDAFRSIRHGTDYVTGLTKNEELVVEKEAQNRIAERETDGKLSNREKNQIYEQVRNDLAKGYIGIDTIESALGGDTYKNYMSATEQETSLQKEYDTLNKMKQGDMTGEQMDRRAELKLFKDVTKKEDITQDIMSSYGQNPKSQFLRTSSTDIIPQNEENASGKSKTMKSLGADIAPTGNYNVRGKDIALEEIAPVQQSEELKELGPIRKDVATVKAEDAMNRKDTFPEVGVQNALNPNVQNEPQSNVSNSNDSTPENTRNASGNGYLSSEDIGPVKQVEDDSALNTLGPIDWKKVAEGFATEYDAWDKKNPTKVFKVGITSKAMRSIGVADKVITMDSGKLIKIRSKHEGMTDGVIKQIPNIINDPMMIVESKTNPSRIVMMGELTDSKGKTVLAVLELNPTSRKGIALDEIKIASAYGKDNLQRFVDTSKILYVNPDKQKTSGWITSTGLQLPVESLTTGSTNSIPQNGEKATEEFINELPTWDDVVKKKPEKDTYAPEPESYPKKKVTTVKERNAAKLQSLKVQLKNEQDIMEKSHASYNAEIRDLQSLYDSKKNKNTKTAQELLDRIERRKNSRDNVDAYYEKRINDIKTKIGKMNTKEFKIVEQRQSKEEEYQTMFGDLIGDTSTWVDKKMGIYYKINTLRRNLRDIVRDANGNRDIAKADAIYDEIQGKYNHNHAKLNREANAIYAKYDEKKITAAEDAYIQMLGEYRHNPDTTLTADAMEKYYEKHKAKIDTKKVDEIIASARQLYDELFRRLNARLEEQGMRPIEYREGYFPHFTDDKQSWLAKLLNWKTKKDNIPTDIAGLTEQFKPARSYQSFDKHRTGDSTDYSFKKGLDMYVQGALDWIYHIEDIQKRRAFENEIRYRHSDQGVKDKVEAIRNNPEYDASEVQDQIDLIYKEARNPLNNFISDFRTQTNTLAGKKHSMDRGTEEWGNRKFYSTMQNISNRVTANMVVGSLSSALTNFIPITQSWAQVSPVSSLRAMRDTIKSYIRKDSSAVDNSDFLTNRLQKSKKLYQSTWDKIIDKAGIMMEAVDNFTSQVVWRSKYLENMKSGMSENEAIKNADQFAENVMAGRSRGNNPTIFDAKNPFIKIATAFQLEVNNQYGYLFKDVPQDIKNEAKGNLLKSYAGVFIGAWIYNMAYSTLTGRDAALDPIGIIEDLLRDLGLFGEDDEEEPAEIVGNLAESVLEELPFVGGLLGGGRIPISSALPYKDSDGVKGALMDFTEDVANFTDGGWKDIGKELANSASYLLLPAGGGQAKKTIQGLGMFSDKHPIAGSYTDSGKLRFSVNDTPLSKLQAALFGQWSSKNAREYIEEGRSPLGEKQTQELVDTGLPMADYWKYRDGLKEQSGTQEKIEYIAGLDLPIDTKNILVNNAVQRETPIDLTEYDNLSGYEEFDFFSKNKELYNFLKENGVSYTDYKILDEKEQSKYKELQKNPEKYQLSLVIAGNITKYVKYRTEISTITSDKDEDGSTISGSEKKKVTRYINGLDIDYGQKLILFRSLYGKDDSYNYEIVEYLNEREDISWSEMESILKSLGFTVHPNGTVTW